MTEPMRGITRFDVITHLDSHSHVHHWNERRGLRRVARWVCYRYDRACGMTKEEASS